MFVVRYVALTALAVWIGGMVALVVFVAPATFRVLQAAAPADGRVLAGALFGEILRLFHIFSYACGGVVIACLLAIKLIGPPPRAFKLRMSLGVLMLAIALYSGMPVTRELARIEAQVSGSVSALPEADPRRVRFDRLHATAEALIATNTVLGIVLLYWYVRE